MTSPPPNILMVVTDQERYDVIGANGGTLARTPRLDSLAAGGVRFEHAFAPTALCSPSRASMLTGLFPHRHGILNNTHGEDALRTELDPHLPTFPALLRRAGYRLGFVGKWHVGLSGPAAVGFDDVFSPVYDVAQAEANRPLRDPISAVFPHDTMTIAGVDPRPLEETETRRDTELALALLAHYARSPEPFLLRVDYEGPHHPYMPPEPYASLYDPTTIPPWPNFEEGPEKPVAQRRLLAQRGVVGLGWEQWQPLVARYLGFVTFLDAEIGRLLDALESLGLAGTTVVLHTTDHGDMTGSHGGQFNKGPLMYDEIYRVPLMVRDPRRPVNGESSSAFVTTLDLMPTILDLAGLDPPPGIDGRSLVPFLDDPERPGRSSIFAEYHGEEWGLYSQRMVRTADAKYVYSPHGEDELYDLRSDPYERINLADQARAAPLLARMQSLLLEWMTDTQDPLRPWASRLLPGPRR